MPNILVCMQTLASGPVESECPFCCHSGCISSSSRLSASTSSVLLLLFLFSDLLWANSPIPAEARAWACDSGVPGISPRVFCDKRASIAFEDLRDRFAGELTGAACLHASGGDISMCLTFSVCKALLPSSKWPVSGSMPFVWCLHLLAHRTYSTASATCMHQGILCDVHSAPGITSCCRQKQ